MSEAARQLLGAERLGDVLTGNEVCRADPETWFGEGPGITAKRACEALCPAATRLACLAEGMSAPFGVWGGMNVRDRRRLARRLGLPMPSWTTIQADERGECDFPERLDETA